METNQNLEKNVGEYLIMASDDVKTIAKLWTIIIIGSIIASLLTIASESFVPLGLVGFASFILTIATIKTLFNLSDNIKNAGLAIGK